MKETKEFNYCVAHYWKDNEGSIGTYTYGSEVQHGTLKDAKQFLKYVRKQSPDKDWKIFILTELPL